MQRIFCLGAVLLACSFSARAADRPATLFQIGVADGDFGELALVGNHTAYSKQFPGDVNFVVGKSDPKQDWPYIQPGPADAWAGRKPHPFKITFQVGSVDQTYDRLVIDLRRGARIRPMRSRPPRGHQLDRLLNASYSASGGPRRPSTIQIGGQRCLFAPAASIPPVSAPHRRELDHPDQHQRELVAVRRCAPRERHPRAGSDGEPACRAASVLQADTGRFTAGRPRFRRQPGRRRPTC